MKPDVLAFHPGQKVWSANGSPAFGFVVAVIMYPAMYRYRVRWDNLELEEHDDFELTDTKPLDLPDDNPTSDHPASGVPSGSPPGSPVGAALDLPSRVRG